MDADQVRAAHADAWEAHGHHRVPLGGGAARLAGIRLMASGLPHAQWNSADVVDPAGADVEGARQWYADKGVPWGVRVALGAVWPHGRYLFSKRMMGLHLESFRAAPSSDGVIFRQAGPADAEAVLNVDSIAFEEPLDVEGPWVEPLLTHPAAIVCVAELDGQAVGVGHCVITDGDAGPAVYLGGIGVLPEARMRGIGTAITTWLVERGRDAGARLGHLSPDTDEAVRVYERLGFVEVDGVDIYVDI